MKARHLTGLTLTLAGALALGGVATAATVAPEPVNVGHRGSAGLSPENTVPSFVQARAAGADLFEVDVQLSADGELFLFHDATGARTTNVAEVFPERAGDPITSFTLDELRQLDAGSYFSAEFAGTPVPTLREAAAVATSRTGINIELKSPENSPGVAAALAAELEVRRHWHRFLARDLLVVSSFDEAALREFHALAPQVPVFLIGAIPQDDAVLQELATWTRGLVTNYRTLDPADVARVRGAGLTLDVYALNSVEAMHEATALGVDSIITDFPVVLTRLQRGEDPFPAANGIEVASVDANPSGSDLQPETGEHVVLTNTSSEPIDVSGYVLQDAVVNRLVIGEGYILPPGGELRVYTASGTNTADRYYVGGTANVLNNTGDSIAVLSPQMELLDLYAY